MERSGTPARLLQGFPGGCLLDGLSVIDHAGRQLPPPRIGDESATPQQQRRVSVVDRNRQGNWAESHDVVVKVLAVRQLDIGKSDPEPFVRVYRLLAEVLPLHQSAPSVPGWATTAGPTGSRQYGRRHQWQTDPLAPPVADALSGYGPGGAATPYRSPR